MSIPDLEEKVIYYDPHTVADTIAAIDYSMQPMKQTTSKQVQEAQSVYELHTMAYGVSVVAETCHAAGCDYAETIRAIKGVLMKRVWIREREARQEAQKEADHDAV